MTFKYSFRALLRHWHGRRRRRRRIRPPSPGRHPFSCLTCTSNLIRTERLNNLNIVPHVLESWCPDMICVNICRAAAPRGTPRLRYAGTSCPAPKTRRYENVPAFLYRPAGLQLTVYVANFWLANSAENFVVKEAICGIKAGRSVREL